MFSVTLNLWGQGAVTLPKQWRDRYPTEHFMATETADGYLLIKPILDAVYYEDDEGFGVRFPMGISASELVEKMKDIQKKAQK